MKVKINVKVKVKIKIKVESKWNKINIRKYKLNIGIKNK